MNLEIIPQAQRDIADAAKFYQRESAELSADFLDEVDRAVAAIVARPTTFEQVRRGLRRYLVERFPYGIYYRMPDEHTIRIILVRHHSRHPGYGTRRK
jgi:toxin ParE1/3/4